ncbi:hypothetical protein [Dehalogenimonas alkenigignens]|uniref:Uncharacterized protein n=1 Tax=Dehalogenimonas alkenigignens TaxID=1217799 RepID=A0A0W0GHT9_9CHLR|nr:hypothetical protein [Dehalogenimonas alkenigignens]KTB48110.1 hypothetical protein DEALK_09550 [Dehalogenimonas alkenigignens]PVV84360.1 hypothetical protein DD509_03440 [Dehalogenimonas alkenigignens]
MAGVLKFVLSLAAVVALALTGAGCGPAETPATESPFTASASQPPSASTTTSLPPPATAAAQTRVVLAEMFTGDW